MSQPNQGLFSVRRTRETLGGISYNGSNIPQPPSAMKRSGSLSGLNNAPLLNNHGRSVSGSRMSLAPPNQPLFQRSSSGANLADMGASSAKRTSIQNASSRKSYAPPATGRQSQEGSERRSSVYRSRQSTAGPMSHQSFFQQAPVPTGVPRDPRPLKDRAYQNRIGQELLDYLSQHNFEMEMKHMLSQNTVRSPTQKDFNFMFQWLYHRIDPSYRFLKNIDAEVPPILKQLRYPFEKSITKSQIAAVGGQNWSTFLGLLHWMMQLAIMLDGYASNQYDEACLEQTNVDVTGDRIIFNFLSGAYRDWLQMDEDADDSDQDRVLAPHVEAMAASFDHANAKYLDELQILEAEHERLAQEIAEVERTTPDIAKLDSFFKTMEEDRVKFEGYDEKMVQKCEKYEARLTFLQEEIDKVLIELKEADDERMSLQKSVDDQGISMQDIDRMNSERERLQKGIETTSLRLEEAKKRVSEKEAEASLKLEELERLVDRFNGLGYQIGLIPATAPNAKGQNYELQLLTNDGPSFSSSQLTSSQANSAESDRLLVDITTGYQPHQILSLDLRSSTKAHLIALRKEVSDRLSSALELRMKNHDLLDGIKEAIEDKRSEVDTLEHRMRAAQEEFERTKETTQTQKLASDAQIEKMEKELGRMRGGLGEELQLMEQREMNTNLEYEQLQLKANALREELHTEIEKMLNDIIKFKVHIQRNLEDYEGAVVEEAEMDLDVEQEDTQNGMQRLGLD